MPTCLSEKTGSCLGCNILAIAAAKLHDNGTTQDTDQIQTVARRVGDEYCPPQARMQSDHLKPPKRSTW